MRAVSFVEHLEFDFSGPVLRNAITLGDVDNDGNNELVVGSENGDVHIFKRDILWQTITGLGFIACIVVGDILNCKQNCLVIIGADGWCHIYYCATDKNEKTEIEQANTAYVEEFEESESDITPSKIPEEQETIETDDLLKCIHVQRIPANSKVALLGDVDGDGAIEIVLGLTDRVVRSYRWCNSPPFSSAINENITGKLVGLNKWECANQIGSVTLHHSADGSPCLLVAQPGGTFMRIKCQPEDTFNSKIENYDISESNSLRSESFAASFVDYQFLGLSRMRNQNISTEIMGDLRTISKEDKSKSKISDDKCSGEDDGKLKIKGNPYSVATLDGTIMLVQDEIILWAIQVDHQTFALSKLDITNNGSDDIVVCSWDGQTYILDQEKNSVRFQLDEPVQAFCSGYYTVHPAEKSVPCLVYVTFWNKIYLYYNIELDSMIAKRFNPDLSAIEGIEKLLSNVNIQDEESTKLEDMSRKTKKEIVEYILYGMH